MKVSEYVPGISQYSPINQQQAHDKCDRILHDGAERHRRLPASLTYSVHAPYIDFKYTTYPRRTWKVKRATRSECHST